jgi:hypothetical protein
MQVEVAIETNETKAILNFQRLQRFLAALPVTESIKKVKVTVWKIGSILERVQYTLLALLMAKKLLMCQKISLINHSECICAFDICFSRTLEFLPNLKTFKITRVEVKNLECVLGQLTNVKIRGLCSVSDILFKLNKNIKKLSLEHIVFNEKLAEFQKVFDTRCVLRINESTPDEAQQLLSTIEQKSAERGHTNLHELRPTKKSPFFVFPELRKLSLNKCRLTAVPKFVCNSKKLLFLSLRGNHITRIERNELPESVVYLFLQFNKIEFIQHVPLHLKYGDFSNNKLTKLPDTILFCSRLKGIMFTENNIISCLPQIRFYALRKQRFTCEDYIYEFRIDYINSFVANKETVDTRVSPRPLGNLYNDKQNIHSRSIQNSFFTSTMTLFWTVGWCPQFVTCGDKYIDAIIHRNCLDRTVHSILLVEYRELFLVIWTRILNEKVPALRQNMIDRLKQEVLEGQGHCFTGKLTRLVNSLVGFCPDIRIQISTPEQIYAKIQSHMARNGGRLDREKLTLELLEIEVPDDKIQEWLGSFE